MLQKQSEDKFISGDILGLMEYEPHSDYRAEVLFDMLYEYVYQARLENKPLHDRGLVITRSFEPSITLTTKIPEESNHHPKNAVSVSIQSCITRTTDDESVNQDLKVYDRFYDKHHEEFKFVELSWGGSIYFKELFIEVPEDDFSEELGYFKLPKVFEHGGISGYQQRLIYHTTDENNKPKKVWMHYLKDLEKSVPEETTLLPPSEPVETENHKPVESVLSLPEGGEQLPLFDID